MKKSNLLYSFYVLFLLLMTMYIGVKPDYNLDMLPYIAIVQKIDGESSVKKIHQTTYIETKKHTSPQEYALLTVGSSYRETMFLDEASFDEQLSFYVIKPLYLLSAYLFYQMGASLPFSTVLPSLLSYFIIGLILLRWVSRILPTPWLTLWICLFIISSEPMVILGKTSAPDAMATAFLLAGCYLFIEKRSLWGTALLFTLSILTRPDYLILSFFIFMVIAVGKWYKKVSTWKLLLCFFLFFASYFIPKLLLDGVAWSTLFHHAFIERLAFPLTAPQGISPADYLAVLADNIVPKTYFARTYLLAIFLFAGVTFWDRFKSRSLALKTWTFNQTFMLALLLTLGLRFLLFPAFLERFMAPFLVLSFLIFVKEISPMLRSLSFSRRRSLLKSEEAALPSFTAASQLPANHS